MGKTRARVSLNVGLDAKADMVMKAVDVRKKGILLRKLFGAGEQMWQGRAIVLDSL